MMKNKEPTVPWLILKDHLDEVQDYIYKLNTVQREFNVKKIDKSESELKFALGIIDFRTKFNQFL